MNVAICINAANIGPYPSKPLGPDKGTALEYVAQYTRSIPGESPVYYLSPEGTVPEGYQWKGISCSTMKEFLSFCRSLDESIDTIVYIFNDTPLINSEITHQMLADHETYRAEYTFAEGFPSGFAPEILSRSGIIHLQNVLGEDDMPLTHTALFDLVSRDINTFDLETKISNTDMRSYRITLGMENKEQFLRTKNILNACLKKGGDITDVTEDTLTSAVTRMEELQRTVPAYFSIQLTDGCPQKCSYCPYPKVNPQLLSTRDAMDVTVYKEILQKITALSETGYVNFSPLGEPSLHPSIEDIIKMTVDSNFKVILETSGIGWQEETVASLNEYCGTNLTWIISLDAKDEGLYTSLRGDGFQEAFSFASRMVDQYGENVYIQCVRLKENEDALEPFFRFWKEKTSNIIIQKYDHYSLFLPENTVSDISPLKRNICWHLKRDMVILLDGSVPVCREDLERNHLLGNILTEDAETIWNRGNDLLIEHKEQRYPGICEKCDEYYTYNF